MARSTHLVSVSVAILLLVVWCKPAYTQPLVGMDLSGFSGSLGPLSSNIPGVAMLDNIGTGETIANVLSTMGVNNRVIESIVTPITNSRDAANTVRDMIMTNVANRRDAVQN
ncbi:hypothetical protein VaNZ11_015543, partial [Volvox africanus]